MLSRLLQMAFRGYEWAKVFQLSALRATWRVRRRRRDREWPVPPASLRVQVAGSAHLDWFQEGGRAAAGSLADVLRRNSVEGASLSAILDFGCGCGRVIRHLPPYFSKARLHGTDIRAPHIAWCRKNLSFASFETNLLEPPTGFVNGQFDLVYALSVLTHLPLPLQFAWMAEFHRLLSPGGYLVVSVHGARSAAGLKGSHLEAFQLGQAVVIHGRAAGSNLCNSYHPHAYMEAVLGPPFHLLDWLPEAAAGNPNQDLYLFQRHQD